MKQPTLFFLFLVLAILLGLVILRPDFVVGHRFGGGAESLDSFARDQESRNFERYLVDRAWTKLASETHPALKPEFSVTVWGSLRDGGERLRGITGGEEGWVCDEPDQLSKFVRPVESAEDAQTLSDLVRRVVPGLSGPMNTKLGTVLEPSAIPSARQLREGRYSPEDAKKWKVEFGERVLTRGEQWTIERIVLLPKTPEMPGHGWSIALVEETIDANGGFRLEVRRTLTEDASEFLVMRW